MAVDVAPHMADHETKQVIPAELVSGTRFGPAKWSQKEVVITERGRQYTYKVNVNMALILQTVRNVCVDLLWRVWYCLTCVMAEHISYKTYGVYVYRL